MVPFRELELRHHALGTPCAWPALNLLCNLTNGRARRHRQVTSETRKHKSTCGKAGDSLLSFRTALSVCLVYSVCLLHFHKKYIKLHSIRHYTDCIYTALCPRVAIRARASHACSSRVCFPANVSSLLETHTSSAWLAWERGTRRLHSVRELIAPIVSACRCVRSAPENPCLWTGFSRVSPAVQVPLLPRQSGVCTRGAHSSIWSRKWRQASPCLRPLPPDGAPAPGELAVRERQLPPAERARRSTTLPPRRRRQWASMSRPNLCSMRSCWRWWLALSINFILIGQPSSRPSCVEASSTSVSCALGRHPPHRSLPFFPDLHTEVCRSWGRPYSSRLFIPPSNYYGNVVGLDECGYRAMPKVEQTLASYLSPHVASSLKAPALPTKPLRTTSTLVGRGYSAAGQAGACLHTMSVLQAYQADLLKELDEREQVSSDDIAELRRTADLSLRATKETARAIGRSMAAMVAAERHLWLTLSDMKDKDRVCLLDAPLSSSGLFGDAVNSVVDRFQEASKQAAAFQWFLPRRSRAQGAAGQQPSTSTGSSYRDAQ